MLVATAYVYGLTFGQATLCVLAVPVVLGACVLGIAMYCEHMRVR